MSVWGPRPVDNDDAADWLADFIDEASVVALSDAFDDVLGEGGEHYLEVTEGAIALMAAEVVAELYGRPSAPAVLDGDELSALRSIARRLVPSAHVNVARRAMAAIKVVVHEPHRSELAQMMNSDIKLNRQWLRMVQKLTNRLDAIVVELEKWRRARPQ